MNPAKNAKGSIGTLEDIGGLVGGLVGNVGITVVGGKYPGYGFSEHGMQGGSVSGIVVVVGLSLVSGNVGIVVGDAVVTFSVLFHELPSPDEEVEFVVGKAVMTVGSSEVMLAQPPSVGVRHSTITIHHFMAHQIYTRYK